MIWRAIDPYFSNTLSLEWKKCKVGRKSDLFWGIENVQYVHTFGLAWRNKSAVQYYNM